MRGSMKKATVSKLFILVAGLCFSGSVLAQNGAPPVNNLYDIAYNGIPVVLDGKLDDWADAKWMYISPDSPVYATPRSVTSPMDFSAYFAIKMDNDHIYFAARVKDDVPLVEFPGTIPWQWDHLAVYLGLYDVGPNNHRSPHVEDETGTWFFTDPVTEAQIPAQRSYRIAPQYDNTGTTLGPDYQIVLRLLEYPEGTASGDLVTYNYGYVDGAIPNTTAVVVLNANEDGYVVEWKVPFASLAGKIARPESLFQNFEWPLFTPSHGQTIIFDLDFGDNDTNDGSNVKFLSANPQANRWKWSYNFGYRGRIVDLQQHAYDLPAANYYIDHKVEQNVVIDGKLDDWADAFFMGIGPDNPAYYPNYGGAGDPNNFSAFMAMKIDNDNLYFAVKARDEGIALNEIPGSIPWQWDHLAVYLGLYDIGDKLRSPHVEDETGTWVFTDPVTNAAIPAVRSYRIAPNYDNTGTTLGPDYQIVLRAIEYLQGSASEDLITYNYGYVDGPIPGTTAVAVLNDSENGYILEWKVPLASLAGKIARTESLFQNFEWPRYAPQDGHIIVFDADIGDNDTDQGGGVVFSSLNPQPNRWKWSYNFGKRGKIVNTDGLGTSIEDDLAGRFELPSEVSLGYNYPNPFNPTTTISYSIPQSQHVHLSVYNILGQQVAVLVDDVRPSGFATVTFDASSLSSGVYVYRIVSGTEIISRKMLLVK
jgi:hypothetical protein